MEPVTTADRHAPKVRAFLKAIESLPNITLASRAAGIRPGMHWRRIKTDPIYKAAFEEAWEIGIGAMEDLAVEAACIGYEEPVIWQGQPQFMVVRNADGMVQYDKDGEAKVVPFTVRKPNPTLHMFILRGAKPEKYRERFAHSGSIEIDASKFVGSMADLLTLYREMTTEEKE